MPVVAYYTETLAREAHARRRTRVPNIGVAAVVAPQEVRLAVAVEVGRVLHGLVGSHGAKILAHEAHIRCRARIPKLGDAVVVAPQDAGLAVAVEVGRV